MQNIGKIFDEEVIGRENKDSYKARIQKKLRAAVFKELTTKQMTHSKVNTIKYNQLNIQSYMKNPSFTNNMVRVELRPDLQ